MAYGSTHTETIPTVGTTLGPAYATAVNAVMTEMRATLNAKVTPAGIDINSDLSMRSGATRYGLTNTHRVTFYQQPSLLSAATYPVSLYSDVSGNLYYNNASSNQIQVTSGSALAGTPGSITGSGYGSAGVALNWDAGSSDYQFLSAASTFADLQCAAVQLSDASSNFIRVAAPAGMSADYTLTLPGAVPASSSVMVMSAAGTVSAAANGVLATTGTVATGALTVTGTAAVSGLITATAGLTAAANQHVTLSGTGAFKHGGKTRTIHASAGIAAAGAPTLTAAGGTHWVGAGATDVIYLPVQVHDGERITAVNIGVDPIAAGTILGELCRQLMTTGAVTVVASASSSGSAAQYITLAGLTEDVNGDRVYFIRVTFAAANDVFYGAAVTYSVL